MGPDRYLQRSEALVPFETMPMPTVYDLAYGTLLVAASPVLWMRPDLRAKLARARRQRNGDVPVRQGDGRCVLIHAVSVGEVNATREMVVQLLAAGETGSEWEGSHPRGPSEQNVRNEDGRALHVVISVTTDAGFERAKQLFAEQQATGRVSVVRYPLDFSKYVRRFLDRLRPDVAVLMELEVWPNFVRECRRRGVPVVLVNGRLTDGSYRKYRWIRPLVRPMYAALSEVCAQEETYARRFIDLGVPRDRVKVTGTMKFDAAQVGERAEGDEALARELGLKPRALGGEEPVLVCGSTGPGEEALLLEAHSKLRQRHERLCLVVVPRKPERFEEVARAMGRAGEVFRRSKTPASHSDAATGILRPTLVRSEEAAELHSGANEQRGSENASSLILGDTIGELRKFYSLADVVVVGRTFVDLGEKQHGSDMIEPAALGKPIVVGPYTGNFAEPMRALLAADAIRQIEQAPSKHTPAAMVDQLVGRLDGWLRDPASAAAIGQRAREVVLANRGATGRHVDVVRKHLEIARLETKRRPEAES